MHPYSCYAHLNKLECTFNTVLNMTILLKAWRQIIMTNIDRCLCVLDFKSSHANGSSYSCSVLYAIVFSLH